MSYYPGQNVPPEALAKFPPFSKRFAIWRDFVSFKSIFPKSGPQKLNYTYKGHLIPVKIDFHL